MLDNWLGFLPPFQVSSLETNMKYCPDCKIIKDPDDFYKAPPKKDGLRSYCKLCSLKRNKEYMVYYREYSKKRYSGDKEFRNRRKESAKKWATPEKNRAHQLVYSWVKIGRLTRGLCEICSSTKVQAHHSDYKKPLDVKWLCPSHHRNIHISINN